MANPPIIHSPSTDLPFAANDGDSISIQGEWIQTGVTVRYNGVLSGSTSNFGDVISDVLPATPYGGPIDIVVTNPDGQSVTMKGAFIKPGPRQTRASGTWTGGSFQPLPADWQDLERKLFGAINGDKGGCWAPLTPLIIGAASPVLGDEQIRLNGPLLIRENGQIQLVQTGTYPGAFIKLQGTDWPVLGPNHVGRTRKIVTSCMQRRTSPLMHWINDTNTGGIRSIACSLQITQRIYEPRPFVWFGLWPPVDTGEKQLPPLNPKFSLPLRVHNGARLTNVDLTFAVAGPRTKVPVQLPRGRVVRVSHLGTVDVLQSQALGANQNGFNSPKTPTSGDDWFKNGAVQTFSYPCDQNNIIDTSEYTYFFQLYEELGTNVNVSPNTADGTTIREVKGDVVVASTTNMTLSGSPPATVDGFSNAFLITGVRILVKDQTDSTQNGIWIINTAGAWTRAVDCSQQSDFTPGWMVIVEFGTKYANTLWECVTPDNSTALSLYTSTAAGSTRVLFQRRLPRGNTYFAATCSFDSIADMRFQ